MVSRAQFELARASEDANRKMLARAEAEYFAQGGLVTRREMDGTLNFLDGAGTVVHTQPPPE